MKKATLLLIALITVSTSAFGEVRKLKSPREFYCTLQKGEMAGTICTDPNEFVEAVTGAGFPPVPGVTVLKISGWTIHAVLGVGTTAPVTQGLQVVFRKRAKGGRFGAWTEASNRYNTGGTLSDYQFGQLSGVAFVPAEKDHEYQFGMRFYRGELIDTATGTYMVSPQALID